MKTQDAERGAISAWEVRPPQIRRRTFCAGLAGSLAYAAAGPVRAAPAGPPPNIVVILADDLGYGDLGCYNRQSKIPTPNLDRLAAAGVRFTDAHTPSAVCTPTRYGLLTGRYCWRTRLKNGVLDGFDPPLIEKDRLTVPLLLKRHGYSTACVGKWHLGMQWTTRGGEPVPFRDPSAGFRPGYDVDYSKPVTGGPLEAGFDYYFGISASLDMSPYCFIENRRTVGIPDVKTPQDRSLVMNQVPGVKATDFELNHVMPVCTKKAVEFIDGRKGTGKPFFLYMPLAAPHLPVVPNKEFEGRSQAGVYGDFVVEVDSAVGSVMAALDRAGVTENTLVIFTSDNGGLWHWWDFREPDDKAHGRLTPRGEYLKDLRHQSNAHLRGTKADIWEGGHRVPFIARWPARIKGPGVTSQLICLTDVLATCADLLGTSLPADAGEDSFSILPALLQGDKAPPVRPDVIHHSVRGWFAIRQGDWKLVEFRGSGGFSMPREIEPNSDQPKGQLFNLRKDPGETQNVYAKHPDVVSRLSGLLQKQRSGRASRTR